MKNPVFVARMLTVHAVALASALFCSVVVLAPVRAQPLPQVPHDVEIEDPSGDANYLNDQGFGVTEAGDVITPADGGSVSDILKVWFTDTPTTISAHIQTQAPRGDTTEGLLYRVRVDPGAGENCLWLEGSAKGTTNQNPSQGSLENTCGDLVSTPADFVQAEGPGGTGLHTITFLRADVEGLEDGGVLRTPTAETRHLWAGVLLVPQIDNTAVGKDYVIGSRGDGGGGAQPTSTPDDCPKKKKSSNSKKCKKKGEG